MVPVLVVLGACSSDSTRLPALLADPMASYEAEGIALIDSWEQEEGRNWIFGKPVHAQVERIYLINDSDRVEAIVAEAAAFAEREGWRVKEPEDGTRLYQGARVMDPGLGRLALSYGPRDRSDPAGPWHLRIFLDYGTVRFDETSTTDVEED